MKGKTMKNAKANLSLETLVLEAIDLQRKQVRNTVIVGGILLAGYFASKNKNRLPSGFFGTAPLDGLGLVRRK